MSVYQSIALFCTQGSIFQPKLGCHAWFCSGQLKLTIRTFKVLFGASWLRLIDRRWSTGWLSSPKMDERAIVLTDVGPRTSTTLSSWSQKIMVLAQINAPNVGSLGCMKLWHATRMPGKKNNSEASWNRPLLRSYSKSARRWAARAQVAQTIRRGQVNKTCWEEIQKMIII